MILYKNVSNLVKTQKQRSCQYAHHMDACKTYGEKVWQQLHKNAASRAEQVLEATPHKKSSCAANYHSSRKQFRRTRYARHCWRSKVELISDVLLWTPSHSRAKNRRPTRPYLQQLCAERGFSLEDLLGAMDDWNGWQERVRKICASNVTWWFRYQYHIYRKHSSKLYLYGYYCIAAPTEL